MANIASLDVAVRIPSRMEKLEIGFIIPTKSVKISGHFPIQIDSTPHHVPHAFQ